MKKEKTSSIEGIWDSTHPDHELKQEVVVESNKTPLQVIEERMVEQVMQQEKGKVYITKLVIVDTQSSDVVIDTMI